MIYIIYNIYIYDVYNIYTYIFKCLPHVSSKGYFLIFISYF